VNNEIIKELIASPVAKDKKYEIGSVYERLGGPRRQVAIISVKELATKGNILLINSVFKWTR